MFVAFIFFSLYTNELSITFTEHVASALQKCFCFYISFCDVFFSSVDLIRKKRM